MNLCLVTNVQTRSLEGCLRLLFIEGGFCELGGVVVPLRSEKASLELFSIKKGYHRFLLLNKSMGAFSLHN